MSYARHQLEVRGELKIAVVILIFLVLFDYSGYAGFLRRAAQILLRPVVGGTAQITAVLERKIRAVSQIGDLTKVNLDLKRQLAEVMVEADQASQLRSENEELQKQMGILPQSVRHYAKARIVAYGSSGYRIYTTESVESGAAVLALGRVIGVVLEVKERLAIVAPIGDSVAKLKVRILPSTKEYDIVNRNGELELEKVKIEDQPSSGALVVTAGERGLVPPDLPVGRVGEVTATKEAIFATVKLDLGEPVAVNSDVYVVVGEAK